MKIRGKLIAVCSVAALAGGVAVVVAWAQPDPKPCCAPKPKHKKLTPAEKKRLAAERRKKAKDKWKPPYEEKVFYCHGGGQSRPLPETREARPPANPSAGGGYQSAAPPAAAPAPEAPAKSCGHEKPPQPFG